MAELEGAVTQTLEFADEVFWAAEVPALQGVLFAGSTQSALSAPASVSASRHNLVLNVFYQRLLKASKPKKVALTAVMRKLLICLNVLLQKAFSEDFWSAKAPQ